MGNFLKDYWSWWIAVGAIVVFLALVFVAGAILWLFKPLSGEVVPQVVMTIIPAPTLTQVIELEPTPTITPEQIIMTEDGFGKGVYVQVYDTGVAGLRIRSGPGTDNSVQFLAMESEVFKIIDGPVEADGFVWWHLSASYDENRNGWAVSDYLKVLSSGSE